MRKLPPLRRRGTPAQRAKRYVKWCRTPPADRVQGDRSANIWRFAMCVQGRCIECLARLVPCTCRPGCPGGMCLRCGRSTRKRSTEVP